MRPASPPRFAAPWGKAPQPRRRIGFATPPVELSSHPSAGGCGARFGRIGFGARRGELGHGRVRCGQARLWSAAELGGCRQAARDPDARRRPGPADLAGRQPVQAEPRRGRLLLAPRGQGAQDRGPFGPHQRKLHLEPRHRKHVDQYDRHPAGRKGHRPAAGRRRHARPAPRDRAGSRHARRPPHRHAPDRGIAGRRRAGRGLDGGQARPGHQGQVRGPRGPVLFRRDRPLSGPHLLAERRSGALARDRGPQPTHGDHQRRAHGAAAGRRQRQGPRPADQRPRPLPLAGPALCVELPDLAGRFSLGLSAVRSGRDREAIVGPARGGGRHRRAFDGPEGPRVPGLAAGGGQGPLPLRRDQRRRLYPCRRR